MLAGDRLEIEPGRIAAEQLRPRRSHVGQRNPIGADQYHRGKKTDAAGGLVRFHYVGALWHAPDRQTQCSDVHVQRCHRQGSRGKFT